MLMAVLERIQPAVDAELAQSMEDLACALNALRAERNDLDNASRLLARQCAAFCDAGDCGNCSQRASCPGPEDPFQAQNWMEITENKTDLKLLDHYA